MPLSYHSIIYELIDELTLLLTGILDPEKKEEFIGYAEVREVFNITKSFQKKPAYIKNSYDYLNDEIKMMKCL